MADSSPNSVQSSVRSNWCGSSLVRFLFPISLFLLVVQAFVFDAFFCASCVHINARTTTTCTFDPIRFCSRVNSVPEPTEMTLEARARCDLLFVSGRAALQFCAALPAPPDSTRNPTRLPTSTRCCPGVSQTARPRKTATPAAPVPQQTHVCGRHADLQR